jgi:hypothetical protein
MHIKLLGPGLSVWSIEYKDFNKKNMKFFSALSYILLPAFISFTPAGAQYRQETLNTLNVSYFGKSVTRPGIKVGTSYTYHGFKPRFHENGDSVTRQLVLLPNIGTYFHFENHYGLFVNAETGFRVVYPKGLFWQVEAGAGFLRTFLAGKVYEVNDQGEVSRIVLAGSNQFMPSAGITLGKNLAEREKLVSAFFGRIGGFLQYPYNTMWLPSITLELGITFNL